MSQGAAGVYDDIWDLVCVGAGITSLAFAAQLLQKKPELRILIVDKHSLAGGYATHFKRPRRTDAEFDCSMHKISGTCAEEGNFFRIFNGLGLSPDVELVPHPDLFEACFPNYNMVLDNDPQAIKSALQSRFAEDAEGIEQYFQEVSTYGRDSYFQYQILDGSYEIDMKRLRYAHRNFKDITVAEALEERFSNEELKHIIAASTIYVGGFAEDMSYLYFMHVVYATMFLGNAYATGGAQHLSDVLVNRIEQAGSCVKLKTRVDKIVPAEAGGVHQVHTTKGVIKCRQLYINAAPQHAVADLFDDQQALQKTKEKLEDLKPARATTTLYLTTDIAPYELGVCSSEMMIFSEPQNVSRELREKAGKTHLEADYEKAFWQASPMEVTNYYSLNPGSGNVLCLNVLDLMCHWPDRKSAEYKLKKQRAANVMLERLLKAKPGLKGHVLHSELASPHTYQRYTFNTLGSGYGAAVRPGAIGHTFHYGFPYQGIKFLSAWVGGSGYEAAFVYSEIMMKKWLSEDKRRQQAAQQNNQEAVTCG